MEIVTIGLKHPVKSRVPNLGQLLDDNRVYRHVLALSCSDHEMTSEGEILIEAAEDPTH